MLDSGIKNNENPYFSLSLLTSLQKQTNEMLSFRNNILYYIIIQAWHVNVST